MGNERIARAVRSRVLSATLACAALLCACTSRGSSPAGDVGNDAPRPDGVELSAPGAVALQTEASLVVTVVRNGNAAAPASVAYATENGTAVAGRDFQAAKGTLSWAAGDAAAKRVEIPLVATAPFAGARSFSVRLSSATGVPLGAQSLATASIGGSSLAIRVKGNRLVDGSGNVVQLRGVNVSGLETVSVQGWAPNNPWGGQTGDPTPNWGAMASWGINAVRIPLNETSWLGRPCIDAGGASANSSPGRTINPDPSGSYRAAVQEAVDAATAKGYYVILDLHWTAPGKFCAMAQNAMADADNSPVFWSQLASAYGGYPNVILEPFNEPYFDGLSRSKAWSGLMSGTTRPSFATGGKPAQFPLEWNTVGMQSLVDTIRGTGARNVIIVSGLDYAKDLGRWLSNRPQDPMNQLGAVWHAYPAFNTRFGTPQYEQPNYAPGIWSDIQDILAAGIPVVITEFGDHDVPGTVGAPFVSKLLPWADANGASYLGWTWDKWGNPDNVLIKDAAGTPTDGYGVYVKAHYLCRAANSGNCR